MKPNSANPPQTRDWKAIRARLATATAEAEAVSSPEGVRKVLEERARVLAQVPAQTRTAAEATEVLRFSLGKERFALATSHIREVLRLKDLTPVPGTPAFVVGITNVRGQILPVYDLRSFFDVPAEKNTALTRVIVLGTDRLEFGLCADAVEEVVLLSADSILEAPGTVAAGARDFLSGVTADALLLLDAATLLSDPRLVIDQQSS